MICFEKPMTFPSAGYELSAYVHIPPQGPKNMVLMLHGFTGNKIEVNRLFVDIARALCRNGVSVFRFDYRGHGESPLDFEEFRFEYAVEDSENALKFVSEAYRPSKIFLIGLSMGGNIAVRLVKSYGNRISGAVLLSPGLNGIELRERMKRSVVKIGNYYYFGAYRLTEEQVEGLHRDNLIEWADKIFVPMLIIHAKDDQAIPYTQSQQFFERLAAKDKKLVLLESGGHVFSTYESKTRVIEEIVNWIKERASEK